MNCADQQTYLNDLCNELGKPWPTNRTINIVCHGHSIPAGYTIEHIVKPFDAYPHILHRRLKDRYPFAVINVIVTAIGGEGSVAGVKRFKRDVLSLKPELITLDYTLNDRYGPFEEGLNAYSSMVDMAKESGSKIILLTPTMDARCCDIPEKMTDIYRRVQMIKDLSAEKSVGLIDTFQAWDNYIKQGGSLSDLLVSVTHPSYKGHQLIVSELMKWFKIM